MCHYTAKLEEGWAAATRPSMENPQRRGADSKVVEPLDAEHHLGVYWDYTAGVGQCVPNVGVEYMSVSDGLRLRCWGNLNGCWETSARAVAIDI